jgi:aryl-alcohol dehydrogenase-like predicted oxidoreductase
VLQRDGIWDAVARLREAGKVVHVGASVNTPVEAMELIRRNRVEVLQVRYNLFHREWEAEVFPAAIEHGVGIIAREPLENGILSGKYDAASRFGPDDHRSGTWPPERLAAIAPALTAFLAVAHGHGLPPAELALRFCLAHPAVGCVIPGAKRPEQVAANVRAGKPDGRADAALAALDDLPAAAV